MGNQLDKIYGYARDMEDIEDTGQIPTEVTGNAIDYHLIDHPAELEPGDEPHDGAIKNHDYILDTHNGDAIDPFFVKGKLDEFDAGQRTAVVTAIGSVETEESDDTDDEQDEE